MQGHIWVELVQAGDLKQFRLKAGVLRVSCQALRTLGASHKVQGDWQVGSMNVEM